MNRFEELNLPTPISHALKSMGYEKPTQIQAEAIPHALEGRDLLATAQTGTGKTAAFAIPLLSRILTGKNKKPVLVIAPTRELAEQIGEVLKQLTEQAPHIRSCVIIGGSSYQHQIRALRSKPSFVVGTPGRLIDQVQRGDLQLEGFGGLVIDEADRLLDMGFLPQLEEIVAHMPKKRQTMMFSATLPDDIIEMAQRYLDDPIRVAVGSVSKPVDRIQQDVIQLLASEKGERLIKEIDKVAGTVIVFVKTKWRAESVAKFLAKSGHDVARIHGERSQKQRSDALRDFREGRVRILVATDIAARGIDVTHIRHVVNYDLPMSPEDYIHRIGRTGRAGAEGHAIAFVTPEELMLWARIHKLMYGRYPEGDPRAMLGSRKQVKQPRVGGGGKTHPRSRGQRKGPGSSSAKRSSPSIADSDAPNRAQRRALKFGNPVPAKPPPAKHWKGDSGETSGHSSGSGPHRPSARPKSKRPSQSGSPRKLSKPSRPR